MSQCLQPGTSPLPGLQPRPAPSSLPLSGLPNWHLDFLAVILSAEALVLRRARQAERRMWRLSEEQEALVQMLLEAHVRHVGPMFDCFVQFRVS